MKNPDMLPKLVLRSAETADTPELLKMVRALAKHHDDTPDITAEAFGRDAFGELPWIYVIVADMGGRLIGYTALSPLVQLQYGTRGVDMHHIFVAKEFRGTGVGRQLVEASVDKARELSCSYMMVGTDPDNLKAQAFYNAFGFRACCV